MEHFANGVTNFNKGGDITPMQLDVMIEVYYSAVLITEAKTKYSVFNSHFSRMYGTLNSMYYNRHGDYHNGLLKTVDEKTIVFVINSLKSLHTQQYNLLIEDLIKELKHLTV
jgi:hypothetical protein